MSTYAGTSSRTAAPRRPSVPAYGPVDAVLSYVVFYVFVDRATPTVADVLSRTVEGLSADLVATGLAALLWFVLVVSALDQTRRQLSAIGVIGEYRDNTRRERGLYGRLSPYALGAVVLVGGGIAYWAFDRAVETGIALITMVVILDPTPFVVVDVVVMAGFFVAFGLAATALDRITVDAVRAGFDE